MYQNTTFEDGIKELQSIGTVSVNWIPNEFRDTNIMNITVSVSYYH